MTEDIRDDILDCTLLSLNDKSSHVFSFAIFNRMIPLSSNYSLDAETILTQESEMYSPLGMLYKGFEFRNIHMAEI